MRHGDLVLDPSARTVLARGNEVHLSAKEFDILQTLMENAGRVMSRSKLSEKVYCLEDEVESNALEVHIHHLRKKFVITSYSIHYTKLYDARSGGGELLTLPSGDAGPSEAQNISFYPRKGEAGFPLLGFSSQRQIDIRHLFVLRCLRHPFDIVEKEREIAQLFTALR